MFQFKLKLNELTNTCNFICLTSQTNLIVIRLSHQSAFSFQAGFNHQVVIVIKFGVIVLIVYCHPETLSVWIMNAVTHYFQEKRSL